MLSNQGTGLYIKLSEIAALAENVVHSDNLSSLPELSVAHQDLMKEIMSTDPVVSEELVAVIEEADGKVKKAIAAIQAKQKEILEELAVGNRKQMLSRYSDY